MNEFVYLAKEISRMLKEEVSASIDSDYGLLLRSCVLLLLLLLLFFCYVPVFCCRIFDLGLRSRWNMFFVVSCCRCLDRLLRMPGTRYRYMDFTYCIYIHSS